MLPRYRISNRFRFLLTHMSATALFDTSTLDYIYYIDPTIKFIANIAFKQIQHELLGVEHPYYPRNHVGFCKQMANTDVLKNGELGVAWCIMPRDAMPCHVM